MIATAAYYYMCGKVISSEMENDYRREDEEQHFPLLFSLIGPTVDLLSFAMVTNTL